MSDFKQDDAVTPVVFRIARGKKAAEIDGPLAVFPCEPSDSYSWYAATCYAHVGQHGGCDTRQVMSRRYRPATPEEYADLKSELEGAPYGYRLKVYQRETPQHRKDRETEWRRHWRRKVPA